MTDLNETTALAEQPANETQEIERSTDSTPVETAAEGTMTEIVEGEQVTADLQAADAEAREMSEEEKAQRAEVEAKLNALEIHYRRKPFYGFVKRVIDLSLSFGGLLLCAPIYLVIAILIKCDDGGPVFYRHKRIGKNGKVIYIHKFRSMKKNADQLASQLTPEQLHQYYTEFKIDNDPRITKIGNFLRRTSLDELPQIWDIFVGRISIIGPRPLVEVETELYYEKRDLFLSVKPGLTGYWQAYARNDVGYADGARQMMELHYVEKRSLWFDIKIFFKTIFSVLQRKGAQ